MVHLFSSSLPLAPQNPINQVHTYTYLPSLDTGESDIPREKTFGY